MIFFCYVVFVGTLFLGAVWWRRKNRTTRHPLGDDAKLRRQAGEHLRKKSDELMEKLMTRVMVLILLPVAGFLLLLQLVNLFGEASVGGRHLTEKDNSIKKLICLRVQHSKKSH